MRVEVRSSSSHLHIHLWPYSEAGRLNSWIVFKDVNPSTWKLEKARITVGNKMLSSTADAAREQAGHLQRVAMLADDLDQTFQSVEDFRNVTVIERTANLIFVAKRPSTGAIEIRIPDQSEYQAQDLQHSRGLMQPFVDAAERKQRQ